MEVHLVGHDPVYSRFGLGQPPEHAPDLLPHLHRDIRIALLRALWDHLERPETWPILNEAAVAPDGRLVSFTWTYDFDAHTTNASGCG